MSKKVFPLFVHSTSGTGGAAHDLYCISDLTFLTGAPQPLRVTSNLPTPISNLDTPLAGAYNPPVVPSTLIHLLSLVNAILNQPVSFTPWSSSLILHPARFLHAGRLPEIIMTLQILRGLAKQLSLRTEPSQTLQIHSWTLPGLQHPRRLLVLVDGLTVPVFTRRM